MKEALAARIPDRLEPNDRQRRILVLKANGYTCPQIGKMMDPQISAHAVHSALFQVYRKYGASNDVNAVAIGIALGDIGVHEIHVPFDQIRRRAA
jgi:DNA-binding CsgD family transcriptional regulator